jgi:hypothetical protein
MPHLTQESFERSVVSRKDGSENILVLLGLTGDPRLRMQNSWTIGETAERDARSEGRPPVTKASDVAAFSRTPPAQFVTVLTILA